VENGSLHIIISNIHVFKKLETERVKSYNYKVVNHIYKDISIIKIKDQVINIGYKITINHKPVSVNHMYGHSRNGRKFLTKKAKDFKKAVEDAFNNAKKTKKYGGDVRAAVVYFFGDKRKHDVDNYSKVLLDSLQGSAYINDEQIRDLRLLKYWDKTNPRVEVTIGSWTRPERDLYYQESQNGGPTNERN